MWSRRTLANQRMSETSDAAIAKFGRVDVWINFAGIGAAWRFWEIPVEDHARMIDINLKGICQSFGTASLHGAALWNSQQLGPIDSEVPLAYHASYSEYKAGVRSLDDALAQELRLARLNDVRVVTVRPWPSDIGGMPPITVAELLAWRPWTTKESRQCSTSKQA